MDHSTTQICRSFMMTRLTSKNTLKLDFLEDENQQHANQSTIQTKLSPATCSDVRLPSQ